MKLERHSLSGAESYARKMLLDGKASSAWIFRKELVGQYQVETTATHRLVQFDIATSGRTEVQEFVPGVEPINGWS